MNKPKKGLQREDNQHKVICIINHIVVKMAGEKVVPPKPETQKKKE